MSIISLFINEAFYDIIFSVYLGLFIGGIIMSIISVFLAEMSTHDSAQDHFDHIDHVDHCDHVDHVDHIDHIDHLDHTDDSGGSGIMDDATPAPFMLLFSTSLLFFGISGILLYYLLVENLRFIMFFATPAISYIITKFISITWKRIAKSRYYTILSTENLLGKKGEVILQVDYRGGVIKIPSLTPMKFEKIHVKPLIPDRRFEKKEKVYICDIKKNQLLVDNNKKLIKNRR